jgi:hypothetical protein
MPEETLPEETLPEETLPEETLPEEEFWVDPPEGWMYGFPKIWNKTENPDVESWLIANGYPEAKTKNCPIRMWSNSKKPKELDNE